MKGKTIRIPFSPPDITDEDIAAVVDVLKSGWITTGPVSKKFEDRLAVIAGAPGCVVLNSCTAGLQIALRLLRVGPGDEVIVPAYTYTASAAVIAHSGARIVMVDNAPGTYMPSIDQVLDAVTSRTKAVIVVDLAGIPYPTVALREALQGNGSQPTEGPFVGIGRPAVIVDGAHSLGATRDGMPAGALGDLTAFSFHAVKNLTTAEGGALCWGPHVLADHREVSATVRRMALHGQTKDALAKSQAGSWEYDVVELAHKANMPDVLAALGLSQLQRYEQAIHRRHQIVRTYKESLSDLVSVATHSSDVFSSSAHLALVDLGRFRDSRSDIIAEMASRGVATNVHYKPLPMLSAYARLGFHVDKFPNALAAYRSELSLPLHTLLQSSDVEYVIDTFRAVLHCAG